jgi:alkanesulfonate monooxygenase SsuD/methylene tetrahydromethanopterin reductase-like flavin-dependent oxidoreductase (luciferase family)
MVGGDGDRLLAATLPYVDAWNTWFNRFGNRAEGLSPLLTRVEAACERAGRDPATLVRSVCVLVEVDGGSGERTAEPASPPLAADDVPAELQALVDAGVDEAILVLDPINERSIRSLRTALPSG